MKASILVSTTLAAITVAACTSGAGTGGAGTSAAGTGGVNGGGGGTSGHTITGGAGGTSGISTAGAGGGSGTGDSSGGMQSAAICPADAPRATTTALPCSPSDVPYGTQCSYAAETSGCREAFECECVSASPGVDCFWHPLGETCANAGSGGVSGGGSGGAGGSGGGSNPCPDTPPTDGTPCSEAEAAFCTYHDCAGAGETNARCQAPVVSMWLVDTKPCEPVECAGGDLKCEQGQICMESRGGALGITCIDDPCGEGPQGCDCPGVCATCTSFSGNTMVCSDCPAGEECL